MGEKTRVLYFMSSGVIGGAEKFVETALDNHSHDFNCDIFFLNSGPFYEHCKKKYKKTFLSPIKVRLKNPFSWVVFQFYFIFFLLRNRYDIVHTTMPYSQLFASLACYLTRTKVFWFQHGPIGPGLDRVASLLPCRHIFFNSKYTEEEHTKIRLKKSRSSILPLAVDVHVDEKNAQCLRDDLLKGEFGQSFLFVSVGRICRWKGFEVAICALGHLKDSRAQLYIIGAPSSEDDKNYYNSLKALVQSLNLNDKVHFLGFQKRIHDYIYIADALIHTSLIPEPFGLVVSEAIALGTYVFGADNGGVRDQLNEKGLGELYHAAINDDSYQELAGKMANLIKSDFSQTKLIGEKKSSNRAQVSKMIEFLEISYFL